MSGFQTDKRGGAASLGTWESPGVLTSLTIGGPISIKLYASGTGRDLSFDAAVSAGGEELGSGSSSSRNLNNEGGFFTISLDIPTTTLETGVTISIDITFSAGMSRNVDLILGDASRLSEMSLSSASIPIETEVHLHGDLLHIRTAVSHHWGTDCVVGGTATVDGIADYIDQPATEETVQDNMIIYDWMIEGAANGEKIITINVEDEAGNIYSNEMTYRVRARESNTSLSGGSLIILGFVLVGVVATGYIGGITPLHSYWDERKMRYLLAFSAGIFISVAVFHTGPESIEMSGWFVLIATFAGFAAVYIIEHYVIKFIDKKFKKKHPKGHPPHSADKDGIALHLHDHHSQDHEICYEDEVTPESNIACTHHLHTTSQAAFAGVAFHNFIEGIVLTMLFLNPETGVISWIVLLAIILHKAPCTLSITSLMKMGGYSSKTIKRGILILLAMTPLGVILTLLAFIGLDELYIGIALAFSTGIFLEIGVLDLVPESMKEKIGRNYAIIAFLAGFGLLFLFSFFS